MNLDLILVLKVHGLSLWMILWITCTASSSTLCKRHHAENQCETSDVESVNCNVKRLAEMSTPLSHKRLFPSDDDAPVAMERCTHESCFQDINFDSMEIPEESITSFNFLDHSHGNYRDIQGSSQERLIMPIENKEQIMQSQPWPNLACNRLCVSYSF